MTNSEASIIIGILPVYGMESQDDCYTIAEYQEAKAIAIKELGKKSCEDCISRAEAIRIASGYCAHQNIAKELRKLPPVTPQPKTGRWIDGKCNRCGTHAPYWAMASTYYCSEYCPNCGAKMVEPQESEREEEE